MKESWAALWGSEALPLLPKEAGSEGGEKGEKMAVKIVHSNPMQVY